MTRVPDHFDAIDGWRLF